ncbi:hypothetical protein NLI96_g721 [Meripilus lineatus]|uniref:Signal recognition particle subunit SRP72 n=1 Tax=Meripilus lineatus TaxID=2056292 RepID=A0AAD5VC98_9APHY|nr:hypothetical protein NLI96_g721 [Physisporinus lineatus]
MGPKTGSARSRNVKQVGKKLKYKSTPKKVVPPADRLKRLFNTLCAQIEGGHFPNAIKTCDKILQLEPEDEDAIQAKLFLLLQTEQYSGALELITKQDDYAFEKSYSLYRLHKEEEVTEVLKELKEESEDDRGVTHLEAQLSYRQGAYQTAFDLYNELLDTAEPDTEEHSDVITNLEASQKHLDFINTGYLHALDALPNSLTNTLEAAPPPSQPHVPTIFTSLNASTLDEQQKAKPSKKVRAKRVPTGVVPGVTPPPDPERWLKKSERSTFHAGHKRRKGGGGATQGLVESAPTPSGGGSTGGTGKGKNKKKR